MYGRSYPLIGVFLALGVWTALDCESQATPVDGVAALTTPAAAVDELTADQKALLEFLQNDGMAALICYGGYVIVPPPTGVSAPPKDPPKDTTFQETPKDPTGDPPDPEDETPDPPDEPPPDHSPEPGSIVLGLLGIGAISLRYLRRRDASAPSS